MCNVCNTCLGEGIINPDNDINTTTLCYDCDGSGRVEEIEVEEIEVDEEVYEALDNLIASLEELADLIDSINQ